VCSGGVAPFCSFSAHAMPVTALAISSGGSHGLVATAGADRNVQICSIAAKSVLGSCMLKSAGTCLAWLPFMNTLLEPQLCCYDSSKSHIHQVRRLCGWFGRSYQAMSQIHKQSLISNPSLLAASLSSTPLLPSIETFGPHRGAVTAIAVTPDASRLVTGGVDCTLVVWNIHTRTSLHIVAVREPVVALMPLLHGPAFTATSAQLPQPSAFKKSVTPVSQLVVQLPAVGGLHVNAV
jgi:WD40 repeat protein